jgi:hypothetical protein
MDVMRRHPLRARAFSSCSRARWSSSLGTAVGDVEMQRRVAEQRLGITPDEMQGGHLVALSRPRELAERLEAYRAEIA